MSPIGVKVKHSWYLVKDYVSILIGLALYSLGWVGFLLPAKITTGGLTGACALIFYGTGFPIQYSFAIINAILILLSLKALGLKYSARTLFGVFFLFVMLDGFQEFITEPLVSDQPFMATIIGGLLCGTGIGLVFISNGSTGGTDIVAALLNKHRNITMGRAVLYVDVAIILSSYLVFKDIEKVVFGLCTMAVYTYAIDMTINGVKQSVQFFIFTRNHEAVADAIIHQAHRGVTIVDGQGWYSKQSTKVVIVMARRNESMQIFRIIHEIDPNALISQASVIGVYGNGFDPLKAKKKKKKEAIEKQEKSE